MGLAARAVNLGFQAAGTAISLAEMQLSELSKAITVAPSSYAYPGQPAHAPEAIYDDPFALIEQLGFRDRPTTMTYGTLRTMVWKVPIIQAIIQTRVNQVAAFATPQPHKFGTGFKIRMRDIEAKPSPADKKYSKFLERLILTTGVTADPRGRDNFETFLRKLTRDSLTFDQTNFEVIPGRDGRPSQWNAVDPATIRLADTPKLYWDEDPFRPHTVQVYDNIAINTFNFREMAFGVRNANTNIRAHGYGTSELEMLVTTVTAILWAWNYNQAFFSQGSVAKGLLNLKGAIPDKQLKAFRRQWYQMIAGVENAWRTPITNAEEIQWINMQSCLGGDATIWTKEHGHARLDEIVVDGRERKVTVWTGAKWAPARAFRTREKKRRCVTTFGDGSKITSSPDHKFWAFDVTGELVWREQHTLREGDYVALNRQAFEAGGIPTLGGREVGPDLFEVLGWATCDGHFQFDKQYDRLRLFYNHKSELGLREEHLSVLRSYGLNASPETQRVLPDSVITSATDVIYLIRLDSVDFVSWLRNYGFRSTAEGKVVPAGVYTLPATYRAAFLRGIFSANGSNHDRRNPILSSRSAKIRTGVRDLLLTLGIRCNPSEGKFVSNPWTGERSEGQSYLKVKDRDRFFALVGFTGALVHKQPRDVPDRAGNTDGLPEAVYLRFLAEVRAADRASGRTTLSVLDRKRLCEIFGGRSRCSRPRLIDFMTRTGVPVPAWLTAYNFEPIVDIERTDELIEMFDLTVDDASHQFVANGVVTHNSNRDMEFSAWMDFLIKVSCSVYAMDPTEVNFKYGSTSQKSMFESGGKAKLTESKERGLRPLLRFLASIINRWIVWPISSEFEFEFQGLDQMTPKELADLNTQRVRTVSMIDEVRAENDQPPLPDGMGQLVLDPNWIALYGFKNAPQVTQGGAGAKAAAGGVSLARKSQRGSVKVGEQQMDKLGRKLEAQNDTESSQEDVSKSQIVLDVAI